MHIQTGYSITKDIEVVLDKDGSNSRRVSFVTKDDKGTNRVIFEVSIEDDTTIEVRSSDTALIGGQIYDNSLRIKPISGNVIKISLPIYEK